MTRMIRGSVLLAACVGIWSCSSDPTADEAGKPFKIVSLPSVVFIKQDSSQLVAFQLLDELDGQIPESWTLSGNTANFNVALDSSFRPVYNSDGTLTLPEKQTEVRATLTGTALGASSFTVSAGGKTLTIPVSVIPGTLHATFAPANPAPGDTVTMTMPPTLRLSPTSAVTFPGNLNPIIIDRAADSMSLRFISAPTTDTTANVTLVANAEFPAIGLFAYNTETKVTGTKSGEWTGNLPGAFSANVTGLAPITVTLTPTFAFRVDGGGGTDSTSLFSFPPSGIPAATIAADSGSASLIIPPNTSSPIRVTRVRFRGAPQFEYTLASGIDSVKSTILITNVPITISPANAQVGDTVTLTAGAGFSFAPRVSSVTFPDPADPTTPKPALVAGNTSAAVMILPIPGTGGIPNFINNVVYNALPGATTAYPASAGAPLAMTNTSIYGGRGDPATATVLTIPPIATDTLEFYDLVENIDQFYQMNFAATTRILFNVAWPAGPDIDMLWCNAGCANFFGGFAGATGANPEAGDVTFITGLAPTPPGQTVSGQFNLYLNLYAGAAPPWVKIRIIRRAP